MAATFAPLFTAGFHRRSRETAADAEAALFGIDYVALILNLGLPDADGISLLKKMRQNHDMRPVLILTARDSTEMLVKGLNSGADDYLCKPFEMDELVARIRALLRRPGLRKSVIMTEATCSWTLLSARLGSAAKLSKSPGANIMRLNS